MTDEEFRRLALALPGAVESAHCGHPDFRVVGRVFASLGAPDAEWGMVALSPEEQRAFIAGAPNVFRPATGAWGERGYTNVHLASVTPATATRALTAAHQQILNRKVRTKRASVS